MMVVPALQVRGHLSIPGIPVSLCPCVPMSLCHYVTCHFVRHLWDVLCSD